MKVLLAILLGIVIGSVSTASASWHGARVEGRIGTQKVYLQLKYW